MAVTDGELLGSGQVYAEDTFIYTPCSGGFIINGNLIIGQPYSCNPSQVNEFIAPQALYYYPNPSLSGGIFNLCSTRENLKQLRITNCDGQLILFSIDNFLKIDLANFPSGIYFYAITDEKENVFRGRIVKE